MVRWPASGYLLHRRSCTTPEIRRENAESRNPARSLKRPAVPLSERSVRHLRVEVRHRSSRI